VNECPAQCRERFQDLPESVIRRITLIALLLVARQSSGVFLKRLVTGEQGQVEDVELSSQLFPAYNLS
jgi:hypothetical protein